MQELWQLYDEQGRPLEGRGAVKNDVFGKGLLHGAAHVWMWRPTDDGKAEVLLQKRAAGKRTWPNLYDISAAGHIDLGETPLAAALRETSEEIDVQLTDNSLRLINVYRAYMVAKDGSIENEFQWLYLVKTDKALAINADAREVDSLEWKPLSVFKLETSNASPEKYVPHGQRYYDTVVSAIESQLMRRD